jgi:hypothetical protein
MAGPQHGEYRHEHEESSSPSEQEDAEHRTRVAACSVRRQMGTCRDGRKEV